MARERDILELGYRAVNIETAQRSLGLAMWLKWSFYRLSRR